MCSVICSTLQNSVLTYRSTKLEPDFPTLTNLTLFRAVLFTSGHTTEYYKILNCTSEYLTHILPLALSTYTTKGLTTHLLTKINTASNRYQFWHSTSNIRNNSFNLRNITKLKYLCNILETVMFILVTVRTRNLLTKLRHVLL